MTTLRFLLCFLLPALLVIGLAGCGSGASDDNAAAASGKPDAEEAAAAPAAPEFTNPIVFQRHHPDNIGHTPPDTWIMDGDGSGLRLLGNDIRMPAISCDQRSLVHTDFGDAYQTDRIPNHWPAVTARIYRFDLATGERTVIREAEGCKILDAVVSPVTRELSWSQRCPGSDGVRKSLIVEVGSGRRLDAALTTALPLMSAVGTRRSVVVEAWSRDDLGPAMPSEIGVIRFDGYGQGTYTALTDREHSHRNPAVSPDGKTVAWQTDQTGDGDGDDDDIFLMDIDGSNQRQLTTAGGQYPWFSRDGRWIVFSSYRSGSGEIWKIEIETGDTVQLTDDPAWDSDRPRW